jgi:hypothetical protein
MTPAPIVYDLYCGLGGWTEGFLSEGYRCIGFDIEAHDYGTGGYPGELRIRDIRSIHGSELKDATCIVGSSPCQEFSYRAMPWKRAKALPPPYLGIELFNAQFRIQREAIEAAGHYIPMVVENVRGAQKWVGQARYHYGSFYLWGDVPALMPSAKAYKTHGMNWSNRELHGQDFTRIAGKQADGIKADGSGWTEKGSLVSHNRLVANTGVQLADGVKVGGLGAAWWREPLQAKRREATAIKNGGDWFGSGENCSEQRKHGSKSSARKAASALIAKIPFPLSLHIARCFEPVA